MDKFELSKYYPYINSCSIYVEESVNWSFLCAIGAIEFDHINGSVQDCGNSIANALELPQSHPQRKPEYKLFIILTGVGQSWQLMGLLLLTLINFNPSMDK